MADKDKPSLELPSFRRRRTSRPAPAAGVPVVEVDGPPRRPRRLQIPAIPAIPASALTGIVVGLAAVGLVWVGQRGCEALSGTSSCGGGPGLLMLLLVVAALVVLGAALLRLLRVDHAGSTSTLAIGIATVVTLLLLADVLFETSGAVFVALTVVAAYVVAQAVTSAAAD